MILLDNNKFYHISDIGKLTELFPLSTAKGSGKKVCYFTPVKAYALFFLRDKDIDHVTCGVSEEGKVIYHEQFPKQLEIMYQGRSGYLYTCNNDDNITIAHTNGIWIATQPVTVVSAKYITDVYIEILKKEQANEVQIIRYESLSDEKKQENTKIIKEFIIKRGFLTADTPQARFFAGYYPQSWKEAEETT